MFGEEEKDAKICPEDVRVLKMPVQKIPAETSCLFFVSASERWSLVSPNRVLLVGLRKCPRIVCATKGALYKTLHKDRRLCLKFANSEGGTIGH